jgi:hypothetical protein
MPTSSVLYHSPQGRCSSQFDRTRMEEGLERRSAPDISCYPRPACVVPGPVCLPQRSPLDCSGVLTTIQATSRTQLHAQVSQSRIFAHDYFPPKPFPDLERLPLGHPLFACGLLPIPHAAVAFALILSSNLVAASCVSLRYVQTAGYGSVAHAAVAVLYTVSAVPQERTPIYLLNNPRK